MKILHISWHDGCIMNFNFVAKSLGYTFEVQRPGWGNYNIGHNRATEIWNKYKDYYNSFDLIITSDTVALSRILLQNNYQGKLIIYVSNRFDYFDGASNDCGFPDPEFYNLIRSARNNPKVKIVPNTPFEIEYAKRYKNVDLSGEIIKPAGFIEEQNPNLPSTIFNPEHTFYLSEYHNHTIFMNMKQKCQELGINVYSGRYNQLSDLQNIKGIINLPYAYSTVSLFENLTMGNVLLLPSKNFLFQLMKQGNYWHQDSYALSSLIDCSEFYLPEHKNIFLYFDNWEHLRYLTQSNELIKNTKNNVIEFSKNHNAKTLEQWKKTIENW